LQRHGVTERHAFVASQALEVLGHRIKKIRGLIFQDGYDARHAGYRGMAHGTGFNDCGRHRSPPCSILAVPFSVWPLPLGLLLVCGLATTAQGLELLDQVHLACEGGVLRGGHEATRSTEAIPPDLQVRLEWGGPLVEVLTDLFDHIAQEGAGLDPWRCLLGARTARGALVIAE